MSRPLSGAPPGKVKAGPHGKDRPSEKNIDHHADGTIIGPYGAAAAEYWDAGWRGVLPLPARRKKEPPDGYTGRTGAWPSRADIQAWTEDGHADGNIALRMPDNVIGVDVDCYDGKPGATTLTRLVAECGPLPATWASTSRSDGSGIRFYRVPPGMSWPGVLGPGIEIIQHVHRYAVVSPSIHPEGRLYSWVSPDGVRTTVIPQPDDLTQLPEPWVAGMTSPSSGGTAPGWTDPTSTSSSTTASQLASTRTTFCGTSCGNSAGSTSHAQLRGQCGTPSSPKPRSPSQSRRPGRTSNGIGRAPTRRFRRLPR